MKTISVFELKLEEAQLSCKTTQRKLWKNWLAKFFLPEYYTFFEENLACLLKLIDEMLGLIATSERHLQRTELLSQALIEASSSTQQIIFVQTISNQAEIAQQLSDIWHEDEEKMIDLRYLLFDFNEYLRDMEYLREQAGPRSWMDWFGFPKPESFPQPISPRLMKELLGPYIHPSKGYTIIEVEPHRLARHNSQESAWPPRNHRPKR